ncbi:MAG: hypothetical protein KJN82_01610 [Bacteroidia bacterium]|nr:hypothetical protein [Bacteroidia bacterium]
MVLTQIVHPTNHNKFIWLNAFALLAFLISGMVDPFAIIMVYFLETIIIGLIHAYKMNYVGKFSRTQSQVKDQNPIFKTFFFLIHYSFFVAVQSIFVFAIFSISDNNISEPFNLIANYKYVLSLKGIGYALCVTFLLLAVQNYFSFFRTKIYNYYTVDRLFIQPYLRIFIQQITVILAGFFIAIFPNGIMTAVLLILIRLFVDLVGIYINSSEGNLKKLASRLASNSDQDEREIYEELKNLF